MLLDQAYMLVWCRKKALVSTLELIYYHVYISVYFYLIYWQWEYSFGWLLDWNWEKRFFLLQFDSIQFPHLLRIGGMQQQRKNLPNNRIIRGVYCCVLLFPTYHFGILFFFSTHCHFNTPPGSNTTCIYQFLSNVLYIVVLFWY